MSAGQHQEFCVRWNSHLGSIGAAFPQLLAGQRFVDVTLACEGHQVHCHRLVLAACSSYFEAILAENPCKHPVIILPSEIKLWEIQALVDFMYKGEVNVTQAGLPQLLRCAEQLRIRGLHGSDAALNLNQLKALTNKAAALAAVANENTTETESTNDTTTTAASRTTPTTTTSATNTQQQQQQQQILAEHFIKKEPNNHSFVAGLPVKQARPSNGQLFNAQEIHASNTRSNFSSADDDDEDEEDDSIATDSPAVAFNQTDEFNASAIDDDHSYVVSNHEDESFNELVTAGNSSSNAHLMSGSFKRVRRSEASLAQAAKCVSKGETFQTVSNMFNIPVSTIRFYMARKGILPKRKRGRGASSNAMGGTMSAGTLADMKQERHLQQQLQQSFTDEDQFHMIHDFKIEDQQVGII